MSTAGDVRQAASTIAAAFALNSNTGLFGPLRPRGGEHPNLG